MTVRFEGAYAVDPQVAIRPEPFGALCYHYGNRRLTFLKSPGHGRRGAQPSTVTTPSPSRSRAAAGIGDARWPSSFVRALDSLEASSGDP